MKKENFTFRFIAFKEKDDTYTAVCLDLDIIEEGHATMEEARLSINDAVISHLNAASKLGFPKELLNRPAPKEYWTRLDEIINVKSGNTSRLDPFSFYTSTPPYHVAI